MKALELTVYYAIPCGGPCQCDSYVLPSGDLVSVQSVNVEAKRLTDAELAAEVWRQEAQVTAVEAMGGTPTRNIAALETLHRFATLPHYDEVTA